MIPTCPECHAWYQKLIRYSQAGGSFEVGIICCATCGVEHDIVPAGWFEQRNDASSSGENKDLA